MMIFGSLYSQCNCSLLSGLPVSWKRVAKNLRPPGEAVRVHGVHVRHHHVHPRPVRVFQEEAKQDGGVEPTDESAGDEAAEKVVEEEVSQDEPDSDPKKIPRLVGYFTADSFDEKANVWKDKSGKNNHAEEVKGEPEIVDSDLFSACTRIIINTRRKIFTKRCCCIVLRTLQVCYMRAGKVVP